MSKHNRERKRIKWAAKGITPIPHRWLYFQGPNWEQYGDCDPIKSDKGFVAVEAVAPSPAELVRIRKHGKRVLS